MNNVLPTSEELERLPMRAVVAYAARTTRRLCLTLRNVIPDEILDETLQLLEALPNADLVRDVAPGSIMDAATRVTDAYMNAPENVKSRGRFLVVFAVGHAAMAAEHLLQAALYPSEARYQMKRVATEAQRTVRLIGVLEKEAAPKAAQAACQDYEILLRTYGQHDQVRIGDSVDCFDQR